MNLNWRKRLRDTREAAGLTQAQLGDLVGQAQTTVSGWEKQVGGTEPGLEVLVRVAEVLNVDPLWLILGITPPAPITSGEVIHRDLIQKVAITFEKKLQTMNRRLPPTTRTKTILKIYDQWVEDGARPEKLEPLVNWYLE